MINNFTEVKPLCYWVQHVLPLVYDDSLSYTELLGKVTKKLNELIVNNNKLPDFIAEQIKEYISSGAIEKVLADILADYMLNVKFPPAGLTPATGDGSADDTEAIQGCIDYAFNHGGMAVYFPSGKYLTQPLTLKNKATLFGQDRYSTVLVMKGGATTAMFTGDVDELTLTGLGFDGNMDIQVNNVNLFTISVNSAIVTNCLLTDGYNLLNITVNDDLQLNNVIFRHAVENALVLKGAGIVQGNNLIFKSISTLVGKNFVVMDVSKSILEQIKCYGASPNAVLINGSNNIVKIWNEQSLKAYTDNGVNNTVEVYTQSEHKKLTGFKTTNVNGDLTETVGGDKMESITGDKHVNTANSVETVQGDKTVTAGDISETTVNKTVHITKDNTEQTDGTRTLTVAGANNETTGTRTENTNGDSLEKVTGTKEINANVLFLNPNKPLKYNKEPIELNKKFKYIPFMYNENEYGVLVKNDGLLNRTFINVIDYGAKGDGVTDDTEAIQRAINENAPTETTGLFLGCDIFFPSGTYVISDTIILPAFINLVGEGRGQTMLYLNNNVNKPLIKTKGYDTFVINKHVRWYITNQVPQLCGVKNMLLFGNKWNNTYEALVQLYGCNITFENVYFYGYKGWAIYQEWGDGVNEEWVLNYDKMSENVFTDCSFFEGDKGIFQSERVNDVSYYNIFMGRIMDIGAEIKGTSYFNYAHFYDCNRNGSSDYALKFSAQGKFNLIIETMHIKPAALFNGYFQDINAECYLNENIDIQLGFTNSNANIKVNGSNEKETTVYVTPGMNNIYNIVQGGSYGRIFIEGISNSILNVTSNKNVLLAQGTAFTNVTGNAIGETVNPGSGVDNVWYPGKS
nr:MAG TPA: peptidase [Caudoviricetes sp.]